MKAKKLLDLMEKKDLFEMANLWPENTNLPVVVWVSEKGKSKHGPRVKVMTHTGKMNIKDTVSITISSQPILIGKLDSKILKAVSKWIILNKQNLLNYWNEEISTNIMINKLKKL